MLPFRASTQTARRQGSRFRRLTPKNTTHIPMNSHTGTHFYFTLCVLTIASLQLSNAQTPIFGRLTDCSHHEIADARVQVLHAQDSTVVGMTFTAADGQFRIDVVRPGAYLLRFSKGGYEDLYSYPLRVSPGRREADMQNQVLRKIPPPGSPPPGRPSLAAKHGLSSIVHAHPSIKSYRPK